MERTHELIGCLQGGLAKYRLHLIDAFVLSQLYEIISKSLTHRWYDKDGNPYFYFSVKTFLELYPQLGIKRRQLSRIIKKYCDIGVLQKANSYLSCSGKYPYYTAPHYRFTKEAFGSLFGHKNHEK